MPALRTRMQQHVSPRTGVEIGDVHTTFAWADFSRRIPDVHIIASTILVFILISVHLTMTLGCFFDHPSPLASEFLFRTDLGQGREEATATPLETRCRALQDDSAAGGANPTGQRLKAYCAAMRYAYLLTRPEWAYYDEEVLALGMT
ncbi:hypothetical protein VDGL01_02360 [Verticillium dahliae]